MTDAAFGPVGDPDTNPGPAAGQHGHRPVA
jgi:hypothetical protein